MITRSELLKMDEDDLRRNVLVPLFKAMGFRDVTLWHGRSTEKGKDIVMWRPADLRERVNYAVVAKRGKISGKASGSSSAGEVIFQIQQAFSEPYTDPITTHVEVIERCYVVTPAEISPEGLEAVKGPLRAQNLDKVTDFITGDTLWELIQKHLPQRAVWDKLDEAMRVFDERLPDYQVAVHFVPGGPAISISPKRPNDPGTKPLNFSGRFRFPNTPEGQQKLEELQRHFRTGSPVMLEGAYVEEWNGPDEVYAALGIDPGIPGRLYIGPTKAERRSPVSLSVIDSDSQIAASLDLIDLAVAQSGDEEATLSNEKQQVPWRVTLVMNRLERKFRLHFRLDFDGVNVRQGLTMARFQEAYRRGGHLAMRHLESGLEVMSAVLAPGTIEPAPEGWPDLLEKLAFIQEKTGAHLFMPKEDITVEAVRTIIRTADKIATGVATYHAASVDLSFEAAEYAEVAAQLSELSLVNLRLPLADSVTIFGVEVPLGPAVAIVEGGTVTAEQLHAVAEQAMKAAQDELVTLTVAVGEGKLVRVEYEQWLDQRGQPE